MKKFASGTLRLYLLLVLFCSLGLPQAYCQVPNVPQSPIINRQIEDDIQQQKQQEVLDNLDNEKQDDQPVIEGVQPQPTSTSPNEETPPPENAPTFLLQAINLNGVTVFTSEELNKLLSPWIGRKVTFNDLVLLMNEINQLYASKGYITTRATLPPQRIKDGNVTIQVVEGRIGKVILKGNDSIGDKYIEPLIDQESGDLFQLSLLEKDVIRLNRDPYLQQVRARIIPGDDPGTSDVELNVIDHRPYRASLTWDNQGRQTQKIGLYRYSGTFSNDNLLGFGDSIMFNGMISDNQRTSSIFTQYKVPLARKWPLKVGFNHAFTRIRLGGSFRSANVVNKSNKWGFFGETALYRGKYVNMTADGGLNIYHSTVHIDNHLLQELTQAPDRPDSVRALTFGVNITEHDKFGNTFIRTSVENGIGMMGATQKFVKVNFDATRQQKITDEISLIVRSQAQIAPQNTTSIAQYQLGGAHNIRGFSEGFRVGDHGYLISAELRFPFFGTPKFIRNNWQGVVFMDHGGIFTNESGLGPTTRGRPGYLTGYGFGIRGRLAKNVHARMDFATTLSPVTDDRVLPHTNLPDMRVHFGFDFNLL